MWSSKGQQWRLSGTYIESSQRITYAATDDRSIGALPMMPQLEKKEVSCRNTQFVLDGVLPM